MERAESSAAVLARTGAEAGCLTALADGDETARRIDARMGRLMGRLPSRDPSPVASRVGIVAVSARWPDRGSLR